MNLASSVPFLTSPLLEVSTSSLTLKSLDLDSKLVASYDLNYPILFTGLTFPSPNLEKAKLIFRIGEIETILEHNSERTLLKPLAFQENVLEKSLGLHAIAFISGFKVTFLISNTPVGCGFNNEISRIFGVSFSTVQIHGFPLNISPNSSAVIPLLNISELFNKNKRMEDYHETNILLGLALINARRFLQAAEVLRKSAGFFQQKPGKTFKAAKIQLLVAEAIKQPSMINEKTQAYLKATELFLGRASSSTPSILISCNFDVYTALLRISPHLCKFLVKMLYEKLDPLKIAAVRGLEFLLEYLGCSISGQLSLILKTIILTYPLQQTHDTEVSLPLSAPIHSQIALKSPENGGKDPLFPDNQQTQKLLVDIYNHLLESFLNVLTSASSNLLRGLFIEIIAPNIFLNEMNGDLRKFVFRIAEKITNICQGDLEINLTFVAALVQYLEGKTHQQINSVRLAAQKLWETVKGKAILNFCPSEARKLGDWVLENLQNIQENPLRDLSSMSPFIEIIRSLCGRERKNNEILGVCGREIRNGINGRNLGVNFEGFSRILTQMIEDLLVVNSSATFMQSGSNNAPTGNNLNSGVPSNVNAMNQASSLHFNSFETIRVFWQCLLEVLNFQEHALKNVREISFHLLQKILNIISEKAPTIQILNSILLFWKTIEESKQELPLNFLIDFFMVFCDCVPHSVYDESFTVFELLLKKIADFLCQKKELIHKAISSLIDQFTVRSKAQKQAKNCLISLIKSQKSIDILFEAWSFTFLQNIEPTLAMDSLEDPLELSLKSNNSLLTSCSLKPRTNKHNSNIGFDSKLFNKNHEIFIEKLAFAEKLFEDLNDNQLQVFLKLLKTPNPVYSSIQRLLGSGNAKVRLKGLKIVRKLLERFVKSRKSFVSFDFSSYLLSKFVLFSIKICWDKSFSDPKLHFNGLLILDQLFQTVLGTPEVTFELQRLFNRKNENNNASYTVIDIFNYEFPEELCLSFEDDRYLHLRLFQILRILPNISGLLNSSWSNIRSLSYGIVCYWVKSDVSFYKPSLMKNLLSSIFTMLLSLLTSKESECRTGGLNILGSFCGFGFDFQKIDIPSILNFFHRFDTLISQAIWESVFDIQSDWDGTNQAAAATLIQLAGPKELISNLFRLKKEFSLLEYNNNLNSTNNGQGNQGNLEFFTEKKELLELTSSKNALGMMSSSLEVKMNNERSNSNHNNNGDEAGGIFWMERLSNEELQELIAMFRNEYKPPQNLWIERANYNEDDIEEDYDRFVYEADEVGNFFFDENVCPSGNEHVFGDEDEDNPENNLEDLGIIEVNDEEWNEYYSEELKTLKNHKSKKGNKLRTGGGMVERPSKIKKEEKKIDEKAALRPHNPLFRPLTPPIAADSKERIAIMEMNPNVDHSPIECNSPSSRNLNPSQNLEDPLKYAMPTYNIRNRPSSGNAKTKENEFFKRRDSTELFEQKYKEKSSSNSQKSEEECKNEMESPLLPLAPKLEEEVIMRETEPIFVEKTKKKGAGNSNNRKSLDKEQLDEMKNSNNSTKLLQKLLETLQMNQKGKNKVGLIEKMLKKQGSPNIDLLDNLLDSLKKTKEKEKPRSSSLGKKPNNTIKKQGKKSNNKEKCNVKMNSGLKKRAKPAKKEEENETL